MNASGIMDGQTEASGGVFKIPFKDVPILFEGVEPRSTSEFWGAVIIIFLLSVVLRGLVILRSYLEESYWGPAKGKSGVQEFGLMRDLGRAGLTFITALLGYAVMLITMTYVAVSIVALWE